VISYPDARIDTPSEAELAEDPPTLRDFEGVLDLDEDLARDSYRETLLEAAIGVSPKDPVPIVGLG
jgi:hypothetical protein